MEIVVFWKFNWNLFPKDPIYNNSSRGQKLKMSSLRQNDVVTQFWRNNNANITSCVRWARSVAVDVIRDGTWDQVPIPLTVYMVYELIITISQI